MLNIRRAKLKDAKGITHVHVVSWQESYKGIINQDDLDNISFEKRLKRRKELLVNPDSHHFCYIAEQNGKIVGFIMCGEYRNPKDSSYPKGEISAIYLLEEVKRKGIGKKLFNTGVKSLLDRNINDIGVWVLQDNISARKFYEKMGGVLFQENSTFEVDGRDYLECMYLFTNTKITKNNV